MALHPSINHINHFKQTSSPSPNQAQVDIISNVGEYLMKYSLGTPPMQILGFVDTGDDFVRNTQWIILYFTSNKIYKSTFI